MSESEERTVRVIYIVSTGHSGSTLLELLLGALPGVVDVGEIHELPIQVDFPERSCGCGVHCTICPFWGPLIRAHGQDFLAADSPVRKFLQADRHAPFFQWRRLLEIVTGKAPPAAELADFERANTALLRAVLAQATMTGTAPAACILDSSKLFYRLYWLHHCGGLDVRAIHLVRDPRGFVASMIRRKSGRLTRGRHAFRMSVRYVLENLLIERVVNRARTPALRLRYEDLASAPGPTLERLATWLNLPYVPGVVDRFREAVQHGVSGNEMRFRSDRIRLDERWKRELSRPLKSLVTLLTLPAAARYGYR
ncbi:MAG: formate dehydrogenase accessory protein FdhE [Kiritimatiellaeota bacterium]|nr:formate dehydrogenase accessory protein FdhE [Kiritimatiellota bacterium]